MHPDFRVFHTHDDTSVVYFQLNTLNLLYSRGTKNDIFTAKIKVEVNAYLNQYDKLPIFKDSAVYVDEDNDQLPKDLIGRITLPLAKGRNYLAKVVITDLNRNTTDTRFIRVLKDIETQDRQGFLPINTTDFVPLVSRNLGNQDTVILEYKLKPTERIQVSFYPPSSRIARPPFDLEGDSREIFRPIRNLTLSDSLGYFYLPTPMEQGIYFIRTDSTATTGCSLFRFSESHPSIGSGEQLLGPLQYIASNEEFKEMSMAANKKLAAENFWIKRSGSKERAKEIIKAFYSRVQDANEFFTSYKEGWKTDRGMIYIIFGPPDGLYMKDDGENWVYGQETNMMSINLQFTKTDNPFSDNELLLQRSGAYRSNWYMAVDFWRTGRIFSL